LSERSSVQNPMLRYAEQIGWRYVNPPEALRLRGDDTGLYFSDILTDQLRKLNPGVVDAGRAEEILRKINLLRPNIEGNRDALSWLRGEQSIFVPEENRERNVQLIDFAHPDNNIFLVTDEWKHRGAAFTNRADAVFLINGIPVAVVESKSAEKNDGLADGISQIRRYHIETPEMMVAPQVFEVTQLIKFFYGATWSTSRKNIFNWKDVVKGDYEHTVKTFFDRSSFLKVLQDYIIFLTKDDDLVKIILRQHQTRAVEKVIDRACDPEKRRGLIWHTQGSGKTLTMITIASRLLRESHGSEKPTVLMLVDRTELESQLFKNIVGYGLGSAKVVSSKRELQSILASDFRGLVVSMIHKFDDVPADMTTRENVIVLVDEAHRTTGGDLGNYLLAALPNATYIGFTGTPIDRLSKGKGTFKVFGVDDPQGYLDKYSIAESIDDGTTVRLNYALAPSDLLVDRETLEREFLSLADAQGISDIEELNAILDRAIELKEMLKSPDRVSKVARYVAQHFRENVEPLGFKAFLVAVDRPACAAYKEELDKYLPPEYSQVVYSPLHNDSLELKKFYISEEGEKKVRKDFLKKNSLPKILIVTQKLLTGFDAPILYCMYLDKPMRDHVLLQAIARVNRPYEDEDGLVKPCGFVLDFVGIFEKLERALAFDSDVVTSVIKNIDVLKMLFHTYMSDVAGKYLALAKGWDDKSKEKAIEYFQDKETRESFFWFFKQVQNIYDILSPDAFLRPFMDDYQSLAKLYALILNAYTEIYVDREVTAKTRQLLQKYTSSGALQPPGVIHQLGPRELKALKDSGTSDATKVLNLRKLIALSSKGSSNSILRLIGERAEALRQDYEDRQITTQEALERFVGLAEDLLNADEERVRLGLDENSFAIYSLIKPETKNLEPNQAKEINALFESYPDYRWDEKQEQRLRAKLYKFILPLVGKEKLTKLADDLLRLRRE
jgi:type I restriction enzyme, R subunit